MVSGKRKPSLQKIIEGTYDRVLVFKNCTGHGNYETITSQNQFEKIILLLACLNSMPLQSTFIAIAVLLLSCNYRLVLKKRNLAQKSLKFQSLGIQWTGDYMYVQSK